MQRFAEMNTGLEVACTIEIDAPADVVWRVLVDFSRFHEWNPFIRAASGEPKTGGTVRVQVQPSILLPFPLIFHATVTACETARRLCWHGHVLGRRVASGDHAFLLEPLARGRTRFTQREVFRGALPSLLRRAVTRETRRGFQAMNLALAARARNARIALERAGCAST